MKELTVKAIPESLNQVTAFVDEQLEALDCPIKAQMQMDVAIDELFSNIAYYAYAPDTGNATVQFSFDESTRTVRLAFMDHGVPFDPLEQTEPDVTLSAEDRRIGGLGIFLVKKTMDQVEYAYRDQMNILTIYKKI